MNMVELKVEELSGAALDYAVAIATEAWKSAHTLYPTMTLDPRFSGVELRPYPRGEFGSILMTCVLVPNNPFRQDPQAYLPSADWSHGGPLIDKYRVDISSPPSDTSPAGWDARVDDGQCLLWIKGSTPLIAACRAIVAAKLGPTVSVPAELVTA